MTKLTFRVLCTWLCLVGIAQWYGGYLVEKYQVSAFYQPEPVVEVAPPEPSPIPISKPVSISVPSVALDAQVVDGDFIDGDWTIASDSANFWIQSATPGQQENTVIYAHNFGNLFDLLPDVSLGDEITLDLEDGRQKKYRVSETMTVAPTTVKTILPSGVEELTLYTCTGWNDVHRFVVKARPIN